MNVQVDLEFKQLLKAVRTLPPGQLNLLKLEIEKEFTEKKEKINLESLLMSGPTATKKQIATIEKNRKNINQWRTLP